MEILISRDEEERLKRELEKRTDTEARRMQRYLSMPDLSRAPDSPLYEIVVRAKSTEALKNFDNIVIPEVVSTQILFDLFNMPPGHPARSKSDTYYVDEDHVLRTHDTVFWYYLLSREDIKEKISKRENIGVICYGKVYRKDEIDSRHMNVFHQFGGLLLEPDERHEVTPDALKHALGEIATSVFGKDVEYRFYDHNFPYTDPSFEMEANINGKWIEMLGSGMARKSVLANFGLKDYHGWAFGFGLERLAIASMDLPDIRLLWSQDNRVRKQLKLGQKFEEVSKYPSIIRDVSFVVGRDFVLNDYFDMIRDVGGDLVEEVRLSDEFESIEKFGVDRKSYTFRITYRSIDRTLTNEEVNEVHRKGEERTVGDFGGTLREAGTA